MHRLNRTLLKHEWSVSARSIIAHKLAQFF
nr:MAG TPA: hypothetical protein [Caudoviricetes sp.]